VQADLSGAQLRMHEEGGEGKSNGKVGPIKVTEPVATARRLAGIRATKPITEEDIPRLRNQWFQDYNDILSGMVPKLPPLRCESKCGFGSEQ